MAGSSLLYAFTFILTILLIALVRRYRKLSHVPGPLLASLTDFWRAYHQNAGNNAAFSLKVHEKYGPIVRVGPNTVHVSDARAIPAIYTNHGEFPKADSYGPLRVPTALGHSVGSVVDMQDESQNSILKRGVGAAFTMKAVLAYENEVDDTALELIQTIQAHPTFNLFQTMQFFQLDFLTKIAFSKSFGQLKERRDIWGMAEPTHQRIVHWVRWQGLPKLEYYLFQHPFWCRAFKIPDSSNWVTEALSQLNSRLKSTDDLPQLKAPNADLLQKYLEAAKKYPGIKPSTLALMTTSTIAAGFDTTTHTFTSIFYYLVRNPSVLQALKAELSGIDMSGSPVPRWEAVNRLPYLDAVIKETMRSNPFLAVALERVVPPTGAEICGVYLPPGTIVGARAKVVHSDANVFGPDVDTFRPERWLEASDEQRLAMERGSLGFGSGKRVCLGRHIAEVELKKVVPALLHAFEISLVEGSSSVMKTDVANFPDTIMVRFEDRRGTGAQEKREP